MGRRPSKNRALPMKLCRVKWSYLQFLEKHRRKLLPVAKVRAKAGAPARKPQPAAKTTNQKPKTLSKKPKLTLSEKSNPLLLFQKKKAGETLPAAQAATAVAGRVSPGGRGVVPAKAKAHLAADETLQSHLAECEDKGVDLGETEFWISRREWERFGEAVFGRCG